MKKKISFFKKQANKMLDKFMGSRLGMVFVLAVGMYMRAMAAPGAGAFGDVAGMIKQYSGTVDSICRAIAACICVVGAFNVYFKMQNGDQDVKKTIMMTVGGAIAFIALEEGLKAFFG